MGAARAGRVPAMCEACPVRTPRHHRHRPECLGAKPRVRDDAEGWGGVAVPTRNGNKVVSKRKGGGYCRW